MTRQEQIIEAGVSYTLSTRPAALAGAALQDVAHELNRNRAFEAGAEWADWTLINKVCKWLDENLATDVRGDGERFVTSLPYDDTKGEFIDRFKQAMEE